MAWPSKDLRRAGASANRPPFGELVKAAFRKRISVARSPSVEWLLRPNLGGMRWKHDDGRFAQCAIRRRQDWLTGEMAYSVAEVELESLPLLTALSNAPPDGGRIQLGALLHDGQDRWWSTGGNLEGLTFRLDWLAQQLQLQMNGFMGSTLPR